jgi:hypothetical protein
MKVKDITDMLDGFDIPVAYRAFPKEKVPSLPFAVYYYSGTDNFVADDKVSKFITGLTVELYTKTKSIATERKIESVLDAYEIPWEKSEDIEIESEHTVEVVYNMEVIIDDEQN